MLRRSAPLLTTAPSRVPAKILGTLLLLVTAVSHFHAPPLRAEAPRVLAAGELPDDERLQPLRDLNGYFPFEVPESTADWRHRAEQVRRRVLVSLGLWPMPTRAPLKAVVHGRIEQPGYTVEKVYFESLPGLFVTGNLYRPADSRGKHPGVLCPHGHWSDGRFYDMGEAAVKKELAAGGELFPDGGRSPLQARCVHLARMGCVVLHYDMIGYADNTQISFEVAHRFQTQRPEMNAAEDWGLFSPQAESHLQSVMGLQTFNSIRALDFLTSLPDVDESRLAVTGASGGGTQTFILAAIDPRPRVAFPAVMVSTAMQGGCTCENACALRIGTGNVEFAALFAPKPLGLTAANDWTKEMASKGFPQLQQLYRMLGAPDNVMLAARTEFGHNYNAPSRAAMYRWFREHLPLSDDAPVEERDYPRLNASELTVWNEQHPRPEGGPETERAVLQWWHEDSQRQLAELRPTDRDSWRKYRDVVGPAVDVLIGQGLPDAADLQFEQSLKTDQPDHVLVAGLLRSKTRGSCLPTLFLYPKAWEGEVVIWLHPEGKSGLYRQGQLRPQVQRLIDSGVSVVGVDLLYQGEFLPDGKTLATTRRVENPREAAAYTFGYNPTVFAHRVHDVLDVIRFVRAHEYQPRAVHLLGLEQAGPWAAAARAQARDAINRAAIDTGGFRFGHVRRIHDPQFLPGGAKYGDLPGMLALSAPDPLWIAGEPRIPPEVAASYSAADASQHVILHQADAPDPLDAAVDWLLQKPEQQPE